MLKFGFDLINRLLKSIKLRLVYLEDGTQADRLCNALEYFNIDTVLDVGSNAGQFANDLRQSGFQGRIVSFEPLLQPHTALTKKARQDNNWIVHPRGALGDCDGKTMINVAGNSLSSSILDITRNHTDAEERSVYTGSEEIDIRKLDSIADQYLSNDTASLLKIDTQGYEQQVLDGARVTLPNIRGILLETSLVELYKGQLLWGDMIERLEKEGFTIWSIDRGFTDLKNSRTLQCDVLFFRTV